MGNSLEQALKRCDFGGARAPPFCAVKRLIGLLETAVFRRLEVLNGFGRVKPKHNQTKAVTCRLSE